MAVIGPINFSGGFTAGYIYRSVPPGLNYATDMMNCRFQNGSVVPRWAQTVVNNATLGAAYVNGLTSWLDAANLKTTLVATCNAKLYTADATSYFPNSTLAFTDRTGALSLSSSSAIRYSFDSLNGILIGVGNTAGGGVPFKLTAYNTNGAVLGGTPPNGDAIKQVNNFLFIGRQMGAASTYSTVSWSNVGDPETWTAGNSVSFNKQDGEPVMALGSIGTDLYIFKQTSIGRLSTYSQSVSGAVTLGPLQTVKKGVGCCGPLAIDNLPNGNIVFVGFDGHLYEFDGSSVIDRSISSYPGPNAYDYAPSAITYGHSVGIANTQTALKVWKGLNEVWIGYDSNIAGASNLYNVWVYDYLNQIWQGYVTDTYPKCFSIIDITAAATAFYEGKSQILFHGNATGSIFGRGYFAQQYPVDESGTPVNFAVVSTVQLGNQSTDFIARSLCLETSDTRATNTAAFSVFLSYTNAFSGSANYSLAGANPNRIFVPIPLLNDSVGSNVFPRVLSIKVICIGAGNVGNPIFALGNMFLGNQVIR